MYIFHHNNLSFLLASLPKYPPLLSNSIHKPSLLFSCKLSESWVIVLTITAPSRLPNPGPHQFPSKLPCVIAFLNFLFMFADAYMIHTYLRAVDFSAKACHCSGKMPNVINNYPHKKSLFFYVGFQSHNLHCNFGVLIFHILHLFT